MVKALQDNSDPGAVTCPDAIKHDDRIVIVWCYSDAIVSAALRQTLAFLRSRGQTLVLISFLNDKFRDDVDKSTCFAKFFVSNCATAENVTKGSHATDRTTSILAVPCLFIIFL